MTSPKPKRGCTCGGARWFLYALVCAATARSGAAGPTAASHLSLQDARLELASNPENVPFPPPCQSDKKPCSECGESTRCISVSGGVVSPGGPASASLVVQPTNVSTHYTSAYALAPGQSCDPTAGGCPLRMTGADPVNATLTDGWRPLFLPTELSAHVPSSAFDSLELGADPSSTEPAPLTGSLSSTPTTLSLAAAPPPAVGATPLGAYETPAFEPLTGSPWKVPFGAYYGGPMAALPLGVRLGAVFYEPTTSLLDETKKDVDVVLHAEIRIFDPNDASNLRPLVATCALAAVVDVGATTVTGVLPCTQHISTETSPSSFTASGGAAVKNECQGATLFDALGFTLTWASTLPTPSALSIWGRWDNAVGCKGTAGVTWPWTPATDGAASTMIRPELAGAVLPPSAPRFLDATLVSADQPLAEGAPTAFLPRIRPGERQLALSVLMYMREGAWWNPQTETQEEAGGVAVSGQFALNSTNYNAPAGGALPGSRRFVSPHFTLPDLLLQRDLVVSTFASGAARLQYFLTRGTASASHGSGGTLAVPSPDAHAQAARLGAGRAGGAAPVSEPRVGMGTSAAGEAFGSLPSKPGSFSPIAELLALCTLQAFITPPQPTFQETKLCPLYDEQGDPLFVKTGAGSAVCACLKGEECPVISSPTDGCDDGVAACLQGSTKCPTATGSRCKREGKDLRIYAYLSTDGQFRFTARLRSEYVSADGEVKVATIQFSSGAEERESVGAPSATQMQSYRVDLDKTPGSSAAEPRCTKVGAYTDIQISRWATNSRPMYTGYVYDSMVQNRLYHPTLQIPYALAAYGDRPARAFSLQVLQDVAFAPEEMVDPTATFWDYRPTALFAVSEYEPFGGGDLLCLGASTPYLSQLLNPMMEGVIGLYGQQALQAEHARLSTGDLSMIPSVQGTTFQVSPYDEVAIVGNTQGIIIQTFVLLGQGAGGNPELRTLAAAWPDPTGPPFSYGAVRSGPDGTYLAPRGTFSFRDHSTMVFRPYAAAEAHPEQLWQEASYQGNRIGYIQSLDAASARLTFEHWRATYGDILFRDSCPFRAFSNSIANTPEWKRGQPRKHGFAMLEPSTRSGGSGWDSGSMSGAMLIWDVGRAQPLRVGTDVDSGAYQVFQGVETPSVARAAAQPPLLTRVTGIHAWAAFSFISDWLNVRSVAPQNPRDALASFQQGNGPFQGVLAIVGRHRTVGGAEQAMRHNAEGVQYMYVQPLIRNVAGGAAGQVCVPNDGEAQMVLDATRVSYAQAFPTVTAAGAPYPFYHKDRQFPIFELAVLDSSTFEQSGWECGGAGAPGTEMPACPVRHTLAFAQKGPAGAPFSLYVSRLQQQGQAVAENRPVLDLTGWAEATPVVGDPAANPFPILGYSGGTLLKPTFVEGVWSRTANLDRPPFVVLVGPKPSQLNRDSFLGFRTAYRITNAGENLATTGCLCTWVTPPMNAPPVDPNVEVPTCEATIDAATHTLRSVTIDRRNDLARWTQAPVLNVMCDSFDPAAPRTTRAQVTVPLRRLGMIVYVAAYDYTVDPPVFRPVLPPIGAGSAYQAAARWLILKPVMPRVRSPVNTPVEFDALQINGVNVAFSETNAQGGSVTLSLRWVGTYRVPASGGAPGRTRSTVFVQRHDAQAAFAWGPAQAPPPAATCAIM